MHTCAHNHTRAVGPELSEWYWLVGLWHLLSHVTPVKEASKLTNNKVVEVVVALSWELSVWTLSLCVYVCVCTCVGGWRMCLCMYMIVSVCSGFIVCHFYLLSPSTPQWPALFEHIHLYCMSVTYIVLLYSYKKHDIKIFVILETSCPVWSIAHTLTVLMKRII